MWEHDIPASKVKSSTILDIAHLLHVNKRQKRQTQEISTLSLMPPARKLFTLSS